MSLSVQRRLQLALTLFEKPYAWRCTVCGRLYSLKGMSPTNDELEVIDQEFSLHICWPISTQDPKIIAEGIIRDSARWIKRQF